MEITVISIVYQGEIMNFVFTNPPTRDDLLKEVEWRFSNLTRDDWNRLFDTTHSKGMRLFEVRTVIRDNSTP